MHSWFIPGVCTCRHAEGAPQNRLEGAAPLLPAASPSSAHDSPVRHGASTIRSPVRRPARNVLFPSPQNVSSLHAWSIVAWRDTYRRNATSAFAWADDCVVRTGSTGLTLGRVDFVQQPKGLWRQHLEFLLKFVRHDSTQLQLRSAFQLPLDV